MSYATPICIIRYTDKGKPEVKKSVMGVLLPELKKMRLAKIFLTAWIDKPNKYVRIYASQNGEVPKRIFKIGCSTNFVRSARWIGRTCNFYRYGKGTESGTVLENFEFGFLTKQKTPKYKEPKSKQRKPRERSPKISDDDFNSARIPAEIEREKEEALLSPAQRLKQKHDIGLMRELSRRREGRRGGEPSLSKKRRPAPDYSDDYGDDEEDEEDEEE